MISVDFEILLPDEPWKDTFAEGKKTTGTYEGEKYLVISIDSDNVIQTVEGQSETAPDLNLFIDPRFTFFTLDASKHPFWAAWFTGNYTSVDFPNFEQTLPDGKIYSYDYHDSAIIDETYIRYAGYKYDAATDTFDTPVPITHSDPNPISAEGVAPHLARYKEIDLSDQSESRKQEIQDYIDWLESAPTVYAGIEQYKVSWPLPPRI